VLPEWEHLLGPGHLDFFSKGLQRVTKKRQSIYDSLVACVSERLCFYWHQDRRIHILKILKAVCK